MKLISTEDLFVLRCAAAEWLAANPKNPNAPAVKETLSRTDLDGLPQRI